MSCSSSASNASTSSPPPRNASVASTVAAAAVGPMIVPPAPPFVVRRMTPEEDLVATLMGIDSLVRQRQKLIEGLMGRHNQLARSNEIGKLAQFSKDIDAILKMRNPTVATPGVVRRGDGVSSQTQRPTATAPRGGAELEWQEFHLRDMGEGEGIRSLQRMLSQERRRKSRTTKGAQMAGQEAQ